MIIAWLLIAIAAASAIANIKFVAPLCLIASIGLYTNARFRWVYRYWHASDDWPRSTRQFGIPWSRVDLVFISVSVVAIVLIALYAPLD
jgi:hypothetical protein